RALHGPQRDPDVVRHRALVVVQVRRQAVQRLDRHRAVLREPSRHREADVRVALVNLAVVLTQVVQAFQAARAPPAADVDLHAHAVARRHFVYVGPYGHHVAAPLVAGDVGEASAGELPGEDLEVGGADRARPHAQQRLTRAGLGLGYRAHHHAVGLG